MNKNEIKKAILSGELAHILREAVEGEIVNESELAYNVIKPLAAQYAKQEVVWGIWLDSNNRVRAVEELQRGTINQSAIYPREIVRRAIDIGATGIILAHNHPGGNPKPSQDDLQITKRLMLALYYVNVTMHDHIIVGAEGYKSMADDGTMAQMRHNLEQMLKLL